MPERSRMHFEARRLKDCIRSFKELELMVVGDVMLDEYLWGDVERVSPEAPVPVVHVTREETTLGGAGNVLRNVIAMGARGRLCGVIGDDEAGDRVVQLLGDLRTDASGLVRIGGHPTTHKTRVCARAQQMLRFDRETETPLSEQATGRLLAVIEKAAPSVQGVVLEDYGKGALSPALLRDALRCFQKAGLPVALDPKHTLEPCKGVSFVKPNLREVETLSGIRVRSEAELAFAVAKLQRQLGGADVVVTRGAEGMSVFEPGQPVLHAPVANHNVFDVQGAGDTAIAALALARLAGANWGEALVISNAAASVVVGKLGTATATPNEIVALLPGAVHGFRKGQSA